MVQEIETLLRVLGDGSSWIWNTASELFPQATEILDRFHAKEHLSQVGKVIYGESPEGKLWIQERYDELDQGRLKSLVEALRDRASQYKEAGECVRHISKNRCRMRYPKFHQRGF
jgi:transposase